VLQNRFFVETIDRLEAQQAELNHKNRQMENDLFLARQVQQALLPQEYPVYPPGVDAPRSQIRFHDLYRSADLLGGDFFHVVHLAEARFGIFICDVMGHGVGSALVTSMMRASLENHLAVSAAPGALLAKINHDLCRMLRNHPHALFATAAYLVLDIAAQRLQFASAGHPIPLRITPHINACRELPLDPQAVGTPLGIVDRADYGTGECPMQPGDRIVLYTDGLYEMTNAAGEVFGSERLKVSLARNRRLAGPDLLASVLEATGKFAAEPEFADDICAVVVAYGVGEDL
jgi:serine phosphatase RsbU (regulator of sigma subunit)